MKRKRKNDLVLSDIKILDVVNELNKINRYPLSIGIFKILSGSREVEYIEYQDFNAYNTLTSISPKRLSRQIANLVNHQYLLKVFSIDSEEPFLQISEKGVKTLLDFYKGKNTKFKKNNSIKKQEIIEIK